MNMALLKKSEPSMMTAEQAAQRRGYASQSELALRGMLEAFCRERWPGARVVHELVMGGRQVRADVVAIDESHIAAFEVKGSYDDTTRLLHQVGMFQLCVPEVWMVVAENHDGDAKLIRHLLPSIGLITAIGMDRHYPFGRDGDRIEFTVSAEPAPRAVVPEMMLEMLWHDELFVCCRDLGRDVGRRATRGAMIKRLLDAAEPDELQRQTCAALRGRDALWRADAPVAARPDADGEVGHPPLDRPA